MTGTGEHAATRHYRRGVVMGLTLAELMILLLFLFLMVLLLVAQEYEERIAVAVRTDEDAVSERLELASLRTERDGLLAKLEQGDARRLDRDAERTMLRAGVAQASAIPLPDDVTRALTAGELNEPLRRLRRLKEERDALRQALRLEDGDPITSAEWVAAVSTLADQVRPGESLQATLIEGLNSLEARGPEACVRHPRIGSQDRGAIAYSFTVTLRPGGVVVTKGDDRARDVPWAGELPEPPYGTLLTPADFNAVTRSYYTAGETGAPTDREGVRRRCRFYLRLQRSMELTDVSEHEFLLQQVQANFFRSFSVNLVD